MRRRSFLATLGAGALAGCSALGGSKFKRAEKPFTQVQSETRGNAIIRSGLVTLGKGEYAAVGFRGGGNDEAFPIEVTGQVMQGGRVDVYIMTLPQFNEFKRKPNLINAEAEATNTQSPTFDRRLPGGQYYLVFDNSSLGPAKPSGEARVQFSITVGSPATTTGTTTTTPSQ